MKTKDLRELTSEELQDRQDEMWTELFGMRIKHALGQLENPLQLRHLRRDIARTKTLLTERGVPEVTRRRRQAPAAAVVAAKSKRTKKPKAEAAAGTAGKE